MEQQEKDNNEISSKKGTISRRGFLGGGSVVAAGVMLGSAGVLSACGDGQQGSDKSGSGATATSTSGFGGIEVYDTDVLVIGTGVSGSLAALQAYSEDLSVLVVDKGPYRSSGVTGMNWDAGCMFFNDPLPEDVTQPPWNQGGLTWADPLTNQKLAKAVQEFIGNTTDAWNVPLIFARLGTPSFHRNEEGGIDDPFPPGSPFRAALGLFGRNSLDYMANKDINIVDNTMVTDFIVSDGKCVGAVGLHVPSGTIRVFRAKATLTSTGASTQMYGWLRTGAISINVPDNTGDTISAAMRHGCAMINPEFFSYDLISFAPQSLGAGFGSNMGADSTNQGLVCDNEGNYFFADGADQGGYVPITRVAIDQIRAGKGGENGGVFLNMAHPDARKLSHMTYRRNIELWKDEFGIDVEEPGYLVEIGPEAFESLGQIAIDENAMTEIPGLFNTRGTGITLQLLGSLPVAGYAGHKAAQYAQKNDIEAVDWSGVEAEIKRLEEIRTKEGTIRPMTMRHAIQKVVYDAISLGSDADGLKAALTEIERIKNEDLPNLYVQNKTMCYNLEWKQAIENHNILQQSEAVLRASLNRTESRSFFYRTDFPEQDDANWLVNSYARLEGNEIKIETAPVVTA